jgi:hypothetical protein
MRTINRNEIVQYIKQLEVLNPQEDNEEYMRGVLELASMIHPEGSFANSVGVYRQDATGSNVDPDQLLVVWDDLTDDMALTSLGLADMSGVNTIVAVVGGSVVLADGGDITGDAYNQTMATASVVLAEGELTQLTLLTDGVVSATWTGSITLTTPA